MHVQIERARQLVLPRAGLAKGLVLGSAIAVLGWSLVGIDWGLGWAVPNSSEANNEEERPALTEAELSAYVQTVLLTAAQIAERYYWPVSPEQLTAAAMVALAEAAGKPVPRHWRHQPEQWFGEGGPAAVLSEFRRQLGNPDSIRGRDLLISLQGMFRILDPHSGFVTMDERKSASQLNGFHFGTGIVLLDRLGKGPFAIAEVRLGSPAFRAGLMPGDKIVGVNDRPTAEMTLAEVEASLAGQADSLNGRVRLKIERPGKSGPTIRQLELPCEQYMEETAIGYQRAGAGWDYWLDKPGGIGYIRILTIGTETVESLKGVLSQLRREGLRGLVLDLRDCPGGVLIGAVQLADLFLGEGPICVVKYRPRVNDPAGRFQPNQQEYVSSTNESFTDFPLAVLIGPETRGGGELIAAAIQDNHRGVLIGERTFGKASVQQNWPLPRPVGQYQEIKLTVGIFVRPSGKNMQRFLGDKEPAEWGVQPDQGFEIRLSKELHQKLRAARNEQALRSPQDRLVVPLGDVKSDPVLFAAIRHLRQTIQSGGTKPSP